MSYLVTITAVRIIVRMQHDHHCIAQVAGLLTVV